VNNPPSLCCDAHKALTSKQAAGAVCQLPITLTTTVSFISGAPHLPTSSCCLLSSFPINFQTRSSAFWYLPQQDSDPI